MYRIILLSDNTSGIVVQFEVYDSRVIFMNLMYH